MYKLIERNGRESGPVDLETLRQWIVQGRVTPSSRIEDARTGVRLPACRIRELWDTFQAVPPRVAAPQQKGSPRPLRLAAAIVLAAAVGWGLWLFFRSNLARTTYTPSLSADTTAPRRGTAR